jgi:hypothetical protein
MNFDGVSLQRHVFHRQNPELLPPVNSEALRGIADLSRKNEQN